MRGPFLHALLPLFAISFLLLGVDTDDSILILTNFAIFTEVLGAPLNLLPEVSTLPDPGSPGRPVVVPLKRRTLSFRYDKVIYLCN